MSVRIAGISSMATRAILAELAQAYRSSTGIEVDFESVGGVDAARRVRDGEAFDLAVLAADVIDQLIAAGRVVPGSRMDFARSGVAIAVRAGAPRPDVGSEYALRSAVLAARTVGHSTGPSGTALRALFERWGIAGQLGQRLVQAPTGIPVGRLVAEGGVELGFQQWSELLPLAGITILGPMPPGSEIVTTFASGLCAASTQPGEVRAFLAHLQAPAAAEVKRRHGMEPA